LEQIAADGVRLFESRSAKEDTMRKVILFASASALLAGAGHCFAQQAANGESPPPAAATRPQEPAPSAQGLVGLPIYSSDGEKVGQVTSIDVSADGRIKSVQAEINGFLGLGTSPLRINADEFKQTGDRILLAKTADEVRGIPGPSYEPRH
jgi:sporulation protein YlmC with PRC-barrel domain